MAALPDAGKAMMIWSFLAGQGIRMVDLQYPIEAYLPGRGQGFFFVEVAAEDLTRAMSLLVEEGLGEWVSL